MYQRSQRRMLIINNRFLSVYDYNFLLVIEKIFSVNQMILIKKLFVFFFIKSWKGSREKLFLIKNLIIKRPEIYFLLKKAFSGCTFFSLCLLFRAPSFLFRRCTEKRMTEKIKEGAQRICFLYFHSQPFLFFFGSQRLTFFFQPSAAGEKRKRAEKKKEENNFLTSSINKRSSPLADGNRLLTFLRFPSQGLDQRPLEGRRL